MNSFFAPAEKNMIYHNIYDILRSNIDKKEMASSIVCLIDQILKDRADSIVEAEEDKLDGKLSPIFTRVG